MSKGKQKNKTWLCVSARYTKDTDCKSVRMDDQQVQEILLRAIQKQCDILDAKVKRLNTVQHNVEKEQIFFRQELKGYKRTIEQVQSEKMKFYEKYTNGELSKEEFIRQKNTLVLRQEEATLQISLLQKRLEELESNARDTQVEIHSIKEQTKYQGITGLTPELVKELVKEIVVYPGEKIRIEWNFRDDVGHRLKKL